MSLVQFELQKGVYNALDTALSAPVYATYAKEGGAFPYIVISGIETYEGDTDTTFGQESIVHLHAFDKNISSTQTIASIMETIDAALHFESISVTGYDVTYCRREYADAFVQTGVAAGDDHYYHGVMRYRVRLVKN